MNLLGIKCQTSNHQQRAICIDAASKYYGWVFYAHPDNKWVTLRKASTPEINSARLYSDVEKFRVDLIGDSQKITADNFWHKDLAEVEGSFLGRDKVTDLPIVNSVDGIPCDAQVNHE